EGLSVEGVMQGEWRFCRENGGLWQGGNFRGGGKHGARTRQDRNGRIDCHATLGDGRRRR
ncbi:MAG TPA: hypothetical protein PKC84_14525, partial [Paracoccaceae bacterium]|nr:hypothetical protein [Paracoccaceae bacterium]